MTSWNFDRVFQKKIRNILESSSRSLSRNRKRVGGLSNIGRDTNSFSYYGIMPNQTSFGPGYYDTQNESKLTILTQSPSFTFFQGWSL